MSANSRSSTSASSGASTTEGDKESGASETEKSPFLARLLWRETTGRSMGSYSPTRWWSKWELMNRLLVQFGDVRPFLDLSPTTRQKLLGTLTDPQKYALLQIELATVDEQFVKATYILEDDGALALECYEIISTIQAAIHA